MPSCVDSRIAAVPARAPGPARKGPPLLLLLLPLLSSQNAKSPGHCEVTGARL